MEENVVESHGEDDIDWYKMGVKEEGENLFVQNPEDIAPIHNNDTPEQSKQWYEDADRLYEQGILRNRRSTETSSQETWRHHIETVEKHSSCIKESEVSWVAITKYGQEAGKNLDRYSKFEQKLNTEHSHLKDEYSQQSQELTKITSVYDERRQEVDQNTVHLRELTEKFVSMKEVLDNQRNKMSDESCLVAIREAIQTLKNDSHQAHVQLGIKLNQLREYQAREAAAVGYGRGVKPK